MAKETTATYTPMFNGATLTITLSYKLQSNAADTAHINAGIWEVKIANVTENSGTDNNMNYLILQDMAGTMVIDKRTYTKPALGSVYTYNGFEQTALLNGDYIDTEMTISQNKKTDAGTYPVRVTLKTPANNKWAGVDDSLDDIIILWTIRNATIQYTATAYTDVYDGKPHEITVNNITIIGNQQYTITYCLIDNGTYVEVAPTFTNYTRVAQTVWFKITAPNHDTITDSRTITISQRQLTVKGVSSEGKVYDGNTNAKVVLNNLGGVIWPDEVVVELVSATFDNASVGSAKIVTLKFRMTKNPNNNYIVPGDEEIWGKIKPAPITCATENYSAEY
ncbi:MAG: YDG domain-containing protein, partial [Clostridia bacterium]